MLCEPCESLVLCMVLSYLSWLASLVFPWSYLVSCACNLQYHCHNHVLLASIILPLHVYYHMMGLLSRCASCLNSRILHAHIEGEFIIKLAPTKVKMCISLGAIWMLSSTT